MGVLKRTLCPLLVLSLDLQTNQAQLAARATAAFAYIQQVGVNEKW